MVNWFYYFGSWYDINKQTKKIIPCNFIEYFLLVLRDNIEDLELSSEY